MEVRRATMDDALDVLVWRNDPQTISMSKTIGPTDRVAHLTWFERTLEDPNKLLYMAVDQGPKVGMIRFDRSGDDWTVSINVAPHQRNKGYGSQILNAGADALRKTVGPSRLVAEIKEGNLASLNLFQKCGFVVEERREGYWLLSRSLL